MPTSTHTHVSWLRIGGIGSGDIFLISHQEDKSQGMVIASMAFRHPREADVAGCRMYEARLLRVICNALTEHFNGPEP